jgi:uncharacterized membrane protein YdjX (TVP38/TMEM64 family)
VAIVIAVTVLARSIPVERGIDWIEGVIGGMGVAAPFVFAGVYALAVVGLVPGSALTLAAGALFGPVWGLVAASLGSTTGASAAFLIARVAGRDRFARMFERYPRFRAIDLAISEGGWKVVAMLRLTPVVPFSISNYMFGLTAIRFTPYVLASWLFMLPGAFMYVYFGHVGRAGLAAASGADATTGALTWTTRLVALAATVAVIVYVTSRARRALERQSSLSSAEPLMNPDADTSAPPTTGWPWRATVLFVSAVVLLLAAGLAWSQRDAIRARLGPPTVVLTEAYQDPVQDTAPPFDHSVFDTLLKKHVDGDGWVDYEGLNADAARLDAYLEAVAAAPFDRMSRDEKLALLINAYNAATLRLILDYQPVKSIKDIPAAKRWDDRRWNVGGTTMSLTDIEHKQIRPKFKEPRIHFALVCAAVGCPKLRNEAFVARRLDAQLDDQMRYAHTHDRWLRFDADRGVLRLTKLYDWYGSDFTQSGVTVEAYAAQYAPALKAVLDSGRRVTRRWLAYDWDLNSRDNMDGR